MFKKGDTVKWVKRQLIGTYQFRFWYAGAELFYCDVVDPDLVNGGVSHFIADAEHCIGYLGPENKSRPAKPTMEIDFKPSEGVQYKGGR